jgi:3-dehydroquinate dehydratase-1
MRRIYMKKVTVKDVVIGHTPVLVCTILEAEIENVLGEVQKSIEAGADIMEIRLDKLDTNDAVRAVFPKIDVPTIASCRAKDAMGFFEGTERERAERLIVALKTGADIIDVELTMRDELRKPLMDEARKRNTPVLIGYENLKKTPEINLLIEKAEAIRNLKPDIAKIAVKANSYEDMISILHLTLLCNGIFDIPFVAIAIGEYGSASRPLGCVLGSSMTYCTTKKKEEAPPGQLSVKDTRTIIEILS